VAPKKIRNYSMGVKVYSMDDMETPVVTEQATEKTEQATENED
jgi:hypothetical protein